MVSMHYLVNAWLERERWDVNLVWTISLLKGDDCNKIIFGENGKILDSIFMEGQGHIFTIYLIISRSTWMVF